MYSCADRLSETTTGESYHQRQHHRRSTCINRRLARQSSVASRRNLRHDYVTMTSYDVSRPAEPAGARQPIY